MIGVCNIDNDMKSELSKFIEICDMNDSSDFVKIDGLVIDWVDKNNDKFVTQAAMVEHYARESIPIVIYDRFMSVTPKEYSWLKKFNVSFLEPALNNRVEFEYLPQWSNLTYSMSDKSFDLGYSGKLNRRVKLFEKYYREVATLWPNTTIKYNPEDHLDDKKEDEWRNDGLFKDYSSYFDFNFSVIIESPDNIDIGYLPDNFLEMMKYGTVPLCAMEIKYFHGIFGQLVVKTSSDVEYYIRCFKNLREVLIEEIYQTIEHHYPEFTIEYACDKIKRKLMI